MKKRLVLLCAITLGLGNLQLPVSAKHHHDDAPPPPAWFNHCDTDHNGSWNWEEFRQAHYRWLETHPGSERLDEKELRKRFRELSKEHDGYVRCADVEKFHAW